MSAAETYRTYAGAVTLVKNISNATGFRGTMHLPHELPRIIIPYSKLDFVSQSELPGRSGPQGMDSTCGTDLPMFSHEKSIYLTMKLHFIIGGDRPNGRVMISCQRIELPIFRHMIAMC